MRKVKGSEGRGRKRVRSREVREEEGREKGQGK